VDPSSVKRRLTCILAADAAGYSRQMGDDEEGTIRVLAAHRAVIDGIITFHQGRIVSTAGWLRLQGKIVADGTARFDAKGLTGDPKYNLKSVRKGAPYEFQVAARFVGSRGTGLRLQLRPCVLTFVRQ
jgi:hypothetical protein